MAVDKKPYFKISPFPDSNSESDSVCKKSRQIKICSGEWNAPTRFFPWAILTATLPPIDPSTIARSVVGTAIQRIPLRIVAAIKPPRSVVAPPPMATILEFRVIP